MVDLATARNTYVMGTVRVTGMLTLALGNAGRLTEPRLLSSLLVSELACLQTRRNT